MGLLCCFVADVKPCMKLGSESALRTSMLQTNGVGDNSRVDGRMSSGPGILCNGVVQYGTPGTC